VLLFSITLVLALTWSVWPASVASAAILRVNYTALGDSLAFGAFAFPGRAYVPLYAAALQNATKLTVITFPLGVPFWTSSDLANALKHNVVFQLSVYGSEAITWNIGGGDLNDARSSFNAGTCGGDDNEQ